jgi:hypothetical protein
MSITIDQRRLSTGASKGASALNGGQQEASPPREGLFGRMLSEAEARMATPGGPAAVWKDPRMLAAIAEGLKRPASGSLYKQVTLSLLGFACTHVPG